ncbi:hypothetical protein [Uliginosibacterium gangwonense]|uniref:hypothetical protein n=1 Tax=Uliginosibacterium gangwonense TaxID=392736 RepID=UPI00037A3AA0|nr:hypothetical protein [Uliginosibacterium gangwonense]
MGFRFEILLTVGLGLSLPAQAENNQWVVLHAVTAPLPDRNEMIQIQLLEDQTESLDPDARVGNIGAPANPRPRKVRITLDDKPNPPGGRIWEFQAPSLTYPDDPCTVVLGPELAVKRNIVTVSFDYQFACGAGASTIVTHRFAVKGQTLSLRTLRFYSASRDGVGTTLIDFRKGSMTRSFDRPEDTSPGKPIRRRFAPYKAAINPQSFLQCPFPVNIGKVPSCSDKKQP